MKTKQKWYKEKSYKFMMIFLLCAMVIFTVGAWIYDGEIREMGAIYLFGGGAIIASILSYIMRNNP